MKILYIEDNYINRLVVQKILQPMGDVKLAVDGPEALKLAGEENFDLFLVDINLNDPEMDGIDVMRLLKNDPRHKQSVFIALTAYTGEAWRKKCIDSGFDNFYSKPIIPDELVKIIRSHFKAQV